jgi:hypothetical protein
LTPSSVRKRNSGPSSRHSLPRSLSLEPLTNPSDRYLVVETRSNWTAIFANGLRVNDVYSSVSYLPRVLKSRGLHVGYAPDLSRIDRKDAIRKWGHTLFTLYGPADTNWENRIRNLSLWNDVGGWSFSESGEVQPFEGRDVQEEETPGPVHP